MIEQNKPSELQEEPIVLLPCPFCGCDGEIVSEQEHDHDGSFYRVQKIQCTECGSSSGFCSTIEWTVASWNRRVKPDCILKQLEDFGNSVGGDFVSDSALLPRPQGRV